MLPYIASLISSHSLTLTHDPDLSREEARSPPAGGSACPGLLRRQPAQIETQANTTCDYCLTKEAQRYK